MPVHLNNVDGSGVRYDMPPGHEDAYMILETPEIAGGPDVETLILGRVEGVRGPEAAFATNVLDPVEVRAELRKFLEVHPGLYQPWDGLMSLANRTDRAARLRRAELLLDEARIDDASDLLKGIQCADDAVRLLTARAARMGGDLDAAASAIAATARTAAADIERVRIAWAREDVDRAGRASSRSWLSMRLRPKGPRRSISAGSCSTAPATTMPRSTSGDAAFACMRPQTRCTAR